MTHLLCLPALLLAAPALAASGNGSAIVGAAAAELIDTMLISHTGGRALSFGKFAPGTGGTVVVTPTGSGTVTGDVSFAAGSNTASDRFGVSGTPGRSYSIYTTGGTVSSGSASMSFTTTPSATAQVLNGGGQGNFTVGGTR